MIIQRALGRVSRRLLPRGHGRVAAWLRRHPGAGDIAYRDQLGLERLADLRDEVESRWFVGAPTGLPAWVLDLVPVDGWVIDAGANVGTTTGQLAVRASKGCVWACEPVPRNVGRLRDLVDRNGLGHVEVLDCALGADDGRALLRLPPDGGSGWASFTASWVASGALDVPVRSIDSLVAEYGAPRTLSFVKIDVEGFEVEVLAGAAKTLAAHRPLLWVEVNHVIQQDRRSTGRELIETVEGYGYTVDPRSSAEVARAETGLADLLFQPHEVPSASS